MIQSVHTVGFDGISELLTDRVENEDAALVLSIFKTLEHFDQKPPQVAFYAKNFGHGLQLYFDRPGLLVFISNGEVENVRELQCMGGRPLYETQNFKPGFGEIFLFERLGIQVASGKVTRVTVDDGKS